MPSATASGGAPPYTYVVSSGALPPGLSLNPATGAITGTPNAPGIFNFTIKATDANGCTGSQNYATSIAAVFVPTTSAIPTLSEWGLMILMALAALVGMRYLRRA